MDKKEPKKSSKIDKMRELREQIARNNDATQEKAEKAKAKSSEKKGKEKCS